MSLLGLCDDIQHLIGEQIKKQPRYRFKAVLEEIKNYEYECGDSMRHLLTLPPILYASQLDEGWLFEGITGWCGAFVFCDNWVVKDYWDTIMERRLYQMEHEDEFYED